MSSVPSAGGTAESPSARTEVVRTGPSVLRTGLDALRRVAPVVDRVSRGIALYAVLALTAGVALWMAILQRGAAGPGRVPTLVVWAVVLAAAPAVLLAVALSLRLLARLPDRLADLPDRARHHVASLGRLAGEARRVRGRGWARSGASVFRLWRTAARSRDLIELGAPMAFLFSPATLLFGVAAMAVSAVEILAGAFALLWLALT